MILRATLSPDFAVNASRASASGYRKEYLEQCWKEATRGKDRTVKGVDLTRYEATRHSFVSRNLKAGVQLDEVSAAVASDATTIVVGRHSRYWLRSPSRQPRGTTSSWDKAASERALRE